MLVQRLLLRTRSCAATLSTKSSLDKNLIKQLREASGAPITDCKKALEVCWVFLPCFLAAASSCAEAGHLYLFDFCHVFLQAAGVNGDLEKAFTHLRKTGKSKATSMAHRTATEGLVGLKLLGNRAVLVEVNSETDFVARNERFQAFVADVAATAFATAAQSTAAGSSALSVSELLAATVPGKGLPLSDALADLIGAIRENIAVRRAVQLTVSPSSGTIGVYVHGSVAPGMGRAAALVGLHTDSSTTADSTAALQAAGKPIAMHCVAAQPRFLSRAEVPDAVLAKERSISVSFVCVCL
jgi:elongation factor Ts